MPSAARNDPERLLAEDPFVRGLARQLLRDAHGAEDVAQQTWLAALRSPAPAAPGPPLRRWLAVLVRRLAGRRARTDRRHLEKLRTAPPAAVVPSAAEIVAREELRSAVVKAVLALDEPYRATVLLRFFEQLPPRQIARLQQVPVETVRTRLKRALQMLRSRLDDRTGGDRAWCGLLLPFARTDALPLPFVAAIPWVLSMTTKLKVAAIAAAVGLLFVSLWALQAPPTGAPEDGTRSPEPVAAAAAHGTADAPQTTAPTAEPVRQAVPQPSAATTGSLLLRVVWGDDHTPAAGVAVTLRRSDDDELSRPTGTTDHDGMLRFAGLHPGKLYPTPLRGSMGWGNAAVVAAGAETESTLELEPGMNLRGVVVDGSDRMIAAAEVLVTGWTGGDTAVVATTAADGTFAIRALATHCHVGARAAGFAACPMRQFTAGKGAEVEVRLVLDAVAAEVVGTVYDGHDRPVAGALVQAGSADSHLLTLPDGGKALAPSPERVRTDADGHFALHHLQAGASPLMVVANGWSVWRQQVDVVAGRQTVVAVHLFPGVTLLGTVRDGAGAAVADASVEVGGDERGISSRRTRSDATGDFRFECLDIGELTVRVESKQAGKGTASVNAAAGQTVRVDVVVSSGLRLRGTVVDADGKPAAGVIVQAQREHPSRDVPWFGVAQSDAGGAFVLEGCAPGEPLWLTFQRRSSFPELRVEHVVPGDEVLTVRLPKEAWIHIQGKVLDPDGKPLPNVHVSPFIKGGSSSPAETTDPATGAFRYGPYPPGEYSLAIESDGLPPMRIPWHAVGPDETWDLGTLQFVRGGTLRVNLVSATAEGGPTPTVAVYDATGKHVTSIAPTAGVLRSHPLQPGDYTVQISGTACAAQRQPCVVRGGVETVVDVHLQPGLAARIVFHVPDGPTDDFAHVVVSEPNGEVVVCADARLDDGRGSTPFVLRPGRYRVEVAVADRRVADDITVATSGPAEFVLRMP